MNTRQARAGGSRCGPDILLTPGPKLFGGALQQSDPIVLYTDFARDECLRRLREALVAEGGKSVFSGKVIGKFDEQGFQLIFVTNSRNEGALPYFRGQLIPEGHGTRVEGCFVVSRFGTANVRILQVFFTGVGVVLLVFAARAQANGQAHALQLPLIWLMLGLPSLLLGIFMPKMIRRQARFHKKIISQFLESALMAQIQPSP